MAGKKYVNTELQNQQWLREGRGSGHGSWLTVRDISSQGRSHRVFGHKSQRTHHLLVQTEHSLRRWRLLRLAGLSDERLTSLADGLLRDVLGA
ncbi:MAG: hypothetical protein ACRDD9_08160 [Shewanella sp.]